jgi:type VI secretion system protein ImpE
MNPSEHFKAGNLQEAIAGQIQEVKANPQDHSRRLFLFELLMFAGDLDRARRQIEAIQYEEMELEMAVNAYRKLVNAEQARQQLFGSGGTPKFMTEPPEHVRLRLEAVTCARENRSDALNELLEKAESASPSLRGELNGKPFDNVRDCDDLFGTVLEVMVSDNYYWVPFEEVSSIVIEQPRFPRDLIWAPAQLELLSGSAGGVFLPVLYPGSHEHADNQVKLGRTTDWTSPEEGPVRGRGSRTFWVDAAAVPLLEWRQLRLSSGPVQ